MNELATESIERRVRAATRALGETWPDAQLPPPRRPHSAAGRRDWLASRRKLVQFVAPAAAAAAVVALALSLVGIGGAVRSGHPGATGGQPAGSGSGSGPVTAGPPVARLVASHVVPPYFVQVTWSGNQDTVPSTPMYAVVRSTATGTVLGTVRASRPGDTVLAATAAADDRTFVLDEEKYVSSTSRQNSAWQVRSFYLLRLAADGRPASVTRLPMTAGRLVTGVALSPDGARLAIAVQPQTGPDPNLTQVRVYTLATGAVRTWTGDGTIGGGADDASSISWTASGQLLFDWASSRQGATATGTRLLDLTRPGTSLIANSRWITTETFSATHPPDPSALRCDAGIVTADGASMVCAAVASVNERVLAGGGLGRDAKVGFFRYSTATGKLTASLATWTVRHVGGLAGTVLWSSANGSVIIGVIPDGGQGRVGVIMNGKFSQLSGRFYGVW